MVDVQTNPEDQTDKLGSSILSVAAEEISLAEAEELVSRHFGIDGVASRLTSERDQNFKIVAGDGREYALRISNHAEDPAINDSRYRPCYTLHRSTRAFRCNAFFVR